MIIEKKGDGQITIDLTGKKKAPAQKDSDAGDVMKKFGVTPEKKKKMMERIIRQLKLLEEEE